MYVKSFRDLVVWQKAMEVVKLVYAYTGSLPKEEIYGLTSQIRRAAVSIPSNIAEGYQRRNRKEFLQFLGIAYGSSAEVETQLILINEIYALGSDDFKSISFKLAEVQKILNAFLSKLNANR
jgi:four helix bundle protein